MSSPEEMGNGPVVHDRRRIDPVTGQVREPDGPKGKHAGGQSQGESARPGETERGAGAEPSGSAPAPANGAAAGAGEKDDGDKELAKVRAELADRTADLQRLQAEYANYRKRVDRDRAAVRDLAVANVLAELLPALDAIGQARQHDELSGGFKSVADSLEGATAKLGLVTYGEEGEPFDPTVHEALTHSYSPDVSEVTCVEIFQPGYKVGGRILRPARVAVAEPATGPDGAPEPGAEPGGGPDGEADGEPAPGGGEAS